MKVYDFNAVLESNGISNPEDSELYHIVDCLECIGIQINAKGPWIAGGAVLRTFLGQPLSTDIDIFFSNESQYNEAYEKMEKNALFQLKTQFSSTFKILVEHKGKEIEHKIQLVKFVYAEKAVNIIGVFDIDICQIAFDGKRIVVPESSLEAIKSKKMSIHVDRITNPAHTFKRVIKYTSRGFSIDEKNLQEFANRFIIGNTIDNESPTTDRY